MDGSEPVLYARAGSVAACKAGHPDSPRQTPRQPKAKHACVPCRRLKIRCLESESHPDQGKENAACARCRRLRIDCYYVVPTTTKQRKGDTQSPMSSEQHVIQPPDAISAPDAYVPSHRYTPYSIQQPRAVLHSSSSSTMPLTQENQDQAGFTYDPEPSYMQLPQQPIEASSASTTRSDPGLISGPARSSIHAAAAFTSVADAVAVAEAPVSLATTLRPLTGSNKARGVKIPDAIDLGLLASFEAAALFQRFHTDLNVYVNMLDPALHTFQYVRETSAVLFSAILAAASKFFRKDLYQVLLAHTQQLLNRALAESCYDISLIQAIGLLVYWRETTDKSAFVKIGIAIRMCYQLGLYFSRDEHIVDDDTSDPLSKLKRKNHKRIWLQMICFDGAYRVRNAQTGQYAPFMIPPSETPRDLSNWISEARAANNLSDLQLAMSTELVRLGHIIESVKSAESMSEHFKNYIFGLIRELRQKWLDGPDAPAWDSIRYAKCKWAFLITSTRAWCMFFLNSGEVHPMNSTPDLVTTTEEAIAAMEAICSLGMLNFLQDSVAFQLFYLAETLCRIYSITTPQFQPTIVKWVMRLYKACQRATASTDSNGVSTLIEQFYQAILKQIGLSASNAPSRGQTPVDNGPQNGNGEAFQQGSQQTWPTANTELFTAFDDLGFDWSQNNFEFDPTYLDSLQTDFNYNFDWLDNLVRQGVP